MRFLLGVASLLAVACATTPVSSPHATTLEVVIATPDGAPAATVRVRAWARRDPLGERTPSGCDGYRDGLRACTAAPCRERLVALARQAAPVAQPVVEAVTDAAGTARLAIAAGLYDVEVDAPGHAGWRFAAEVPREQRVELVLAALLPPFGVSLPRGLAGLEAWLLSTSRDVTVPLQVVGGELRVPARAAGDWEVLMVAPQRQAALERVEAVLRGGPSLDRPTPREVVIKNADGTPAVGATVVANGACGVVIGATDEGGRFSWTASTSGVLAFLGGDAAKSWGKEVVLAPGQLLTGTLRTTDGRALVGDLTLEPVGRRKLMDVWNASSDATGRYVLGPLVPGDYLLSASAFGALKRKAVPVTVLAGVAPKLDVELERAPSLVGVVRDEAGARRSVRTRVEARCGDEQTWAPVLADGSFSVSLPCASGATVGLRESGFLPAVLALTSLAPVEVVLQRGACVEVRGADDGSAVAASLAVAKRLPSDPGVLRVCGLPPGPTHLAWESRPADLARPGVVREHAEQVEVPTTGTVVVKTPPFPPGPRTVEGQVVDGSGAPWTFERVDVIAKRLRAQVWTDEGGRFSLAGLPAGDYLVAIGRDDFVRVTEGVAVTLRKPRAAQLTFMPRAPDGLVLKTLEVTSDGERLFPSCLGGKCELSVAPRENLTLVLSVEGFAPQTLTVSVKDGEARALGEVQFAVGRTVVGKLRDASGKPVAGKVLVWPTARPPDPKELFSRRLPGQVTSAQGDFTLEHLGDEEHTVSARGLEGGAATVSMPRKAKTVEVRLPRGTRVEVSLATRPGPGQTGRVLFARAKGSPSAVSIGTDGRAHSEALEDGEWLVFYDADAIISFEQRPPVTAYRPRRITVPKDTSVTLEPRDGVLTAEVTVAGSSAWRMKSVVLLDTELTVPTSSELDTLEHLVLPEPSLAKLAFLFRGLSPGRVTVLVSWENEQGGVRQTRHVHALAEGATRVTVPAPE